MNLEKNNPTESLDQKKVLVVGVGASGVAACRFLHGRGAKVLAIDEREELSSEALELRDLGVHVLPGVRVMPSESYDFAVISPGIPLDGPLMRQIKRRRIPFFGELELGYQHSLCLNIAISGTNGKTTTTELISKVLSHCNRSTIAAGNIGLPLCAVVEKTKQLDFLTLEVSSFQLESIRYFRPSVAVLLNITPDHLDRYSSMKEYIRAKGRLFLNQQQFDWAIIQSEALAQLKAQRIGIPAKVITFSAHDSNADIYWDRGLIISRLPDWRGPLLDMDHCHLRGPHNAENMMATLAMGRTLRLPLEQVVAALKEYRQAPHRCELVAEIDGVQFINDSKATNLDALLRALQSVSPGAGNQPNVWLLAGGKDKGFDFHDVGPILTQRVKRAYLFGEAREKIRAAWSLFTPCTGVNSLLEAVTEAARNAVPGDVVLLSPACSSFDQFRNYQHRGEVFRAAVERCRQTSDCGVGKSNPHLHDDAGKTEPAGVET